MPTASRLAVAGATGRANCDVVLFILLVRTKLWCPLRVHVQQQAPVQHMHLACLCKAL